ncbi:MAG: hypothetical protein ACYDD1_05480 [Caulobacteraceae bacterium]
MSKALWDQMQAVAKANGFEGCTDAITRAMAAEAAEARAVDQGEIITTLNQEIDLLQGRLAALEGADR